MESQEPRRIVILGAGFGGLYAALELERTVAREAGVEVVLVNRENFSLFTPMLHEVAASDLDLTHIVNPVRKLLRRVRFVHAEVERVDLAERRVVFSHGGEHHHHELTYDHLILALGSVTNFYDIPGLAERAVTMKSLGDAIHLRNLVIDRLEQADYECVAAERQRLLTVVVAGGGFAGVETMAALNDFLRDAVEFYPHLEITDLRLVLVHASEVILPELGPELGAYAQRKLAERGVEIVTGQRVAGFGDGGVALGDGRVLPAATLVWTAGTSPHPLVAALPAAREGGRLRVDENLAVPGWPGVWAVGDGAWIPDGRGGAHPPTAQHALREGRQAARNVVAALRGRPPRPFRFGGLGQLAALGKRTGVARVFGLRFSGFAAWWLWRTVYLSKLPRLEKKVRVLLDWTLDLVFRKDLVQFETLRSPALDHDEESGAGTRAAQG